MFIGEYSHTIDTKGRLIVPSKFREQLGEEFVVTKGLDGCLFVYENTEWKSFILKGSLSFVWLAGLSVAFRGKEVGRPLSSLGSSFTSKGETPAPPWLVLSGVLDFIMVPTSSVPPPSLCCPRQALSLRWGGPLTSGSGISSFTLASVLRKC